MKKSKIARILNDKDRETILKFFNMVLGFKAPKSEFDIDAHLKKNFILFTVFLDFVFENEDNLKDLRCRLENV